VCAGRDSSVVIATRYDSLRAEQSGDQIPLEARFSALVQTVPGSRPASYTMGTGSFPVLKRPGRGVAYPPSRAEVKESVELYLYSTSGPSWPVLGDLYLYICTCVFFFCNTESTVVARGLTIWFLMWEISDWKLNFNIYSSSSNCD